MALKSEPKVTGKRKRNNAPLKEQFLLQVLHWSREIDGMLKIQPKEVVEEKVLRSLRWSKNDMDTCQFIRESDHYQSQMYYEFGIFSTLYPGTEIPDWINCKNKGASISFTIASSPNQLRGLHICCVQKPRFPNVSFEYLSDHWFDFPLIKISNITRNRTWIYHHCIRPVCAEEKSQIYLSHWMFGQTDMGAGGHVTINVTEVDDIQLLTQCGVSLMYDDGSNEEDEEDALGYYTHWSRSVSLSSSNRRVHPIEQAFLLELYYFRQSIILSSLSFR